MTILPKCQFYRILLVLLPLVASQTTIPTNQTTENTTEPSSSTIPEETFDYVIKLVFGLENEKIPEYLVNVIFGNSNNVTTADIIALYSLENVNLSRTSKMLEELDYSPSNFFSVNGLENILNELKLNFKNFYDTIFLNKLNVSGIQLRNFLQKLDININDFSNAITYGDGDPFEIFKKGNFSEVNMQSGLQELGKTKEELFDVCREEIIKSVVTKSTSEIIEILKKYNFDEKRALQLWYYSNINIDDDVNNIKAFSDILDDFKFSLNDTTYLGVFTDKYVVVNRDVINHINDKLQLSKLFAQKLTENKSIPLLTAPKCYNERIVTLAVDNKNFTTSAEIDTTTKNLENCTFVTLKNGSLLQQSVKKTLLKDLYLEVSLDDLNITEIILGSPLICNNKVYGLAKNIEKENIVFDTFIMVEYSSASYFTMSILCLLCSLIYIIV